MADHIKKILITLLSTSLFIITSTITYASPGPLDANGCHYCRNNCREFNLLPNEYHCHGQTNQTQVLGIANDTTIERDNENLEQAKYNAMIVGSFLAAFLGYKLFKPKAWQQ